MLVFSFPLWLANALSLLRSSVSSNSRRSHSGCRRVETSARLVERSTDMRFVVAVVVTVVRREGGDTISVVIGRGSVCETGAFGRTGVSCGSSLSQPPPPQGSPTFTPRAVNDDVRI